MSGRVVTFYSYKGGVGRSFLLANAAVLLCQWGHRVLCVDWDLEAPGLQHYFDEWTVTTDRPGIVDFVLSVQDGKSPISWGRMLRRVEVPNSVGVLQLISAGGSSGDYHERVQSINWAFAYEQGLGAALERMRAEWKERYDFILIDSRTGVSDIAGISTVQLPDSLVCVFTANRQSIDGAASTLRSIVAGRQKMPFDREQLLTLPVLSRFAQDKEYDLATHWMDKARDASAPAFAQWLNRDVTVDAMMRVTRIPEIAYWTFGERVPVLLQSENTSDPQSITYPITNIAALIAHGFGDTEQLMLSRESYIAAAANTQRSARHAGIEPELKPVAISSSMRPKSVQFAAEFEGRSEELGVRVIDDLGMDAHSQVRLRRLTLARILIVLLDEQLTAWQSSDIEGFFSVTLRSADGGLIIPVALTPDAIGQAPSLLRSFPMIHAFDGMTDDVLAALRSYIERAAISGPT